MSRPARGETAPDARRRSLLAARTAGACVLGIVAQAAVNMPDGYFGAIDQVTRFGVQYSAGMIALTLALGGLILRRPNLADRVAPAILLVSIGLFIPALAADPVIAGGVILWNLALVFLHSFPPTVTPGGGGASRALRWEESEPPDPLTAALRHLAMASLALAVAVVGYRLSGRLLAQISCLVLGYATVALAFPLFRELHRQRRFGYLTVIAPALLSLIFLGAPTISLSLTAVTQGLLLALVIGRQRAVAETLQHFYDHPARLILSSFAIVIVLGTLVLTFPAASAGPFSVTPIDAFFTATSATCVTGLIVLDTPAAFSPFGQAIILLLIQVGGLGIMVLSTYGMVLLGGRLGLRGERAMAEMLDLQLAPTVYRLTRFIVVAALGIELLGALALLPSFLIDGQSFGQAAWLAIFHAISAFCNAGFALQSDSLVSFQQQPVMLMVVAALIVAGGLGFAVLANLWARLRRRRSSVMETQSRVVLAFTAALLAAGTLLYASLEWHRSLDGLSPLAKVFNAFFQSATLRTAGFNSVDLATNGSATICFMILFMFIGASPGSTGGGIKTTTLAVLLASVRSTIEGREQVRLFGREVPQTIVFRSLVIVVLSSALVAGACFLLLIFEHQEFLTLLFEVVSAFATVGLSLGATAALGPAGKLLLIAVMFAGRVGPLTLVLLLATTRSRAHASHFPSTRLMVG
jgi:trk system potassium uptake protein TrkH